MADNTRGGSESGTAPLIATDEVTYSGETADVQLIRLVNVVGTEGSKTVEAISTGVQYIEDAALTPVASQGTLVLGRGSSANPTAVGTDGDAVGQWMTRRGASVVATQVVATAGDDLSNSAAIGFSVATDGSLVVPATAGYLFDGTTWDRVRGDSSFGIDVDVTRMPALVASSANIGDVDVLTLPGVGGLAAHASPTSGNPLYVAGRASSAIPTDVGADGDAAGMWTNRSGAQVVVAAPHIGLNSDPWNLVHEGAQYTSAQTSTVLVAGGASEKIVVTKVQIQAFATTAGTAILYFGTGAYSRGTNRAIFDGEFAPSATSKPGVVLDGPFIAGANGDDLMVTTTNALSITFSVWYYVVT